MFYIAYAKDEFVNDQELSYYIFPANITIVRYCPRSKAWRFNVIGHSHHDITETFIGELVSSSDDPEDIRLYIKAKSKEGSSNGS